MPINEEEIRTFILGKYYPLNKTEQRLIMGKILEEALEKFAKTYKNKLDGVKEYGSSFTQESKKRMINNFRLLNENIKLELTNISNFYFEKIIDLLEVPNKKEFYTNALNKK